MVCLYYIHVREYLALFLLHVYTRIICACTYMCILEFSHTHAVRNDVKKQWYGIIKLYTCIYIYMCICCIHILYMYRQYKHVHENIVELQPSELQTASRDVRQSPKLQDMLQPTPAMYTCMYRSNSVHIPLELVTAAEVEEEASATD